MDTLNNRIMLYSTKGVMLLGVKIIKYKNFQSDNLTTFLTSGEEWKNPTDFHRQNSPTA